MKFFLTIAFVLAPVLLLSQDVPTSTEQQLENLGEEANDDDALLQLLTFYQKHPLNLNAASGEDLDGLHILSALQTQNFLRYRNAFGMLLSIYELQAVPGFGLLTIRRLLPYVQVSQATDIATAILARLKGGERSVLLRFSRIFEKAKGYDPQERNGYLGDANRILLRYNYQYKTLLSYGITGDKDPGEQFFRGAQKSGFDFYSAHFFIRDLGHLKVLALGDYLVNLGQGLTQWQSTAFGKSGEIMAIKRQSAVLLPYRSAGEFSFSRGAAATLQFGNWQFTSFVSRKRFSGNLEHDSTDRFTSFQSSGYYRTPSEIADRYRLTDFSTGGNVRFEGKHFRLGTNAVLHQFSLPLEKSDAPYNRFAFSGTRLAQASVDYSLTLANTHFFGEVAMSSGGGRAYLNGLLASLSPSTDVSVLYRHINKAYQSPFGNAFTESSIPGNESGLYFGLSVRLSAPWQLSAYTDAYQFPFLHYRISLPARGTDHLVQVLFAPTRQTEVYLRYRSEQKPEDAAGGNLLTPIPKARSSIRFHFTTSINPSFTFKGRTELSWVRKEEKEEGFLLYVEAAHEVDRKFSWNTRLQYFETDGFDSRIYAYESDVYAAFSTPAFFNKGFRLYANGAFQLTKSLKLWLKLSRTIYLDQSFIGSGLELIDDNKKTQIEVQFRYAN